MKTTTSKSESGYRFGRMLGCGVIALFLASAAVADSGITSDHMEVPSAVSPLSADTSKSERQALKLDYSGDFTGLHIVLPPPSEEEKQSMEEADSKRTVIGFHREVSGAPDGDLSPQLEWSEQSDGTFVSSLQVTSPGAASLRAGIRAELTPGGEIRFYGTESDETFSVVTDEDFYVVDDEIQTLWSPTVDGDTLGIELSLPSRKAVDAFWMVVDRVAHSPYSMSSFDKAAKLRCPSIHIDAQCASGSIHGDLEDATAQIRFEDGGSFACSGTLMNDTVQPGFIPYFLTANHCVDSDSVARTVEAWWWYQRASCGSTRVDSRSVRTTDGATLLATNASYDTTLLRFRRSAPGGLTYSGWSDQALSHPVDVYGVHHPDGDLKKYSEGTTRGSGLSTAPGIAVTNAIAVRWSRGTTEGGSSGSGLFLESTGRLVGALSHGPACAYNITDQYGPFRDFFPQISRWLAPDGTLGAADVVLPLITKATNRNQQGFVRVINASNQSGVVRIDAVDNLGRRFGPAHLSLAAGSSRNFNSRDLEQGNASIGLHGGVGSGDGDWRVELRADFDIQARAYIRTPDGFLTAMHQVSPETRPGSLRYHVPFFNPGSNTSLQSILRLVNTSSASASVTISGVDAEGNGAPLGNVSFDLPGGRGVLATAQQLEQGAPGLRGRLGTGTGKWQLYVSSNRPLLVMGLMLTRSGHLSNLSE